MKNILKVLIQLLERKTIVSEKNAQDGNNRLYVAKGKISSRNYPKLNSEKITYKWRISTLWDQSSSLICIFLGSPKKRKVNRKKANKP